MAEMSVTLVQITLQLRSNNLGVGYRLNLMLELTSVGAILPSFDVETRLLDPENENRLFIYGTITLVLVLIFSLDELWQIQREGLADYFCNVWNVMDWATSMLYYLLYRQLMHCIHLGSLRPCTSELCETVGYFDDYSLMSAYSNAKRIFSICICLQLFKLLKLFSALVPRHSRYLPAATQPFFLQALDLARAHANPWPTLSHPHSNPNHPASDPNPIQPGPSSHISLHPTQMRRHPAPTPLRLHCGLKDGAGDKRAAQGGSRHALFWCHLHHLDALLLQHALHPGTRAPFHALQCATLA